MTRRNRALLQGVLLSASVAGGLTLAARPASADHYRRCDDVVIVREYRPRAYFVPVRVYDPCDDGYVRVRRYHDRYDYDRPTLYFRHSRHHHHWDY